ncbi:MAG: M28 family peptidase, partial [Candidatus Zixiibacteriota bacterium]
MKKAVLLIVVCLMAASAGAGDLYKVTLHSQKDAARLDETKAEVLLWADGGYLVYVEDSQPEGVRRTGLEMELLARGVQRGRLAIERHPFQADLERISVLYENTRIRVVQLDDGQIANQPLKLIGQVDRQFPLKYNVRPPAAFFELPFDADGLDTIVAKVDQAMLEWYVDTLVFSGHRLTGTLANERMRYFMFFELLDYGYDSIYLEPFIGKQQWELTSCDSYNVVATKVGSVYPDKQIVIAGHFDTVPDCPGADDNGTGTAAVLELARILMGLETQMTMVFIAFDSEESWMIGSYHYVDEAVARGDDIVLMVNLDMMAHETNNTEALAYYGLEPAYAALWAQMAAIYGGITSTDTINYMISDCQPFHEAGYDAIWLHEAEFSDNYHKTTDIPEHLNFDYLTRMVKATLATVFVVDRCLPRPSIVLVEDPGDGQSQLIHWESSAEPSIQGYRLSYFPTSSPETITAIDVSSSDTCETVTGLTEDVEYSFYVQVIYSEGYLSLPSACVNGIPHSEPQPPAHVVTIPELRAIRISWQYEQTELDFAHSRVIRDGQIIADLTDTFYIDSHGSLGSDFHEYYIVACDLEGNYSDTTEFDPVAGKAATLREGRILAVNRSCEAMSSFYVDAEKTGQFLNEALDGYNFDYFSDTMAIVPTFNGDVLDLVEMVDYE